MEIRPLVGIAQSGHSWRNERESETRPVRFGLDCISGKFTTSCLREKDNRV